MQKRRCQIFPILTILWLCVIYSFSLEPADLSEDTSLGLIGWMLEHVVPWLKDEVANLSEGQMLFLHGMVRKAAHFTEYFILGVLSAASVLQIEAGKNIRCGMHHRVRLTPRLMQGAAALIFCIAAAPADETIQLFVEGRAGMVRDVVLDSFGAAVGIGAVLVLIKLRKRTSRFPVKNRK